MEEIQKLAEEIENNFFNIYIKQNLNLSIDSSFGTIKENLTNKINDEFKLKLDRHDLFFEIETSQTDSEKIEDDQKRIKLAIKNDLILSMKLKILAKFKAVLLFYSDVNLFLTGISLPINNLIDEVKKSFGVQNKCDFDLISDDPALVLIDKIHGHLEILFPNDYTRINAKFKYQNEEKNRLDKYIDNIENNTLFYTFTFQVEFKDSFDLEVHLKNIFSEPLLLARTISWYWFNPDKKIDLNLVSYNTYLDVANKLDAIVRSSNYSTLEEKGWTVMIDSVDKYTSTLEDSKDKLNSIIKNELMINMTMYIYRGVKEYIIYQENVIFFPTNIQLSSYKLRDILLTDFFGSQNKHDFQLVSSDTINILKYKIELKIEELLPNDYLFVRISPKYAKSYDKLDIYINNIIADNLYYYFSLYTYNGQEKKVEIHLKNIRIVDNDLLKIILNYFESILPLNITQYHPIHYILTTLKNNLFSTISIPESKNFNLKFRDNYNETLKVASLLNAFENNQGKVWLIISFAGNDYEKIIYFQISTESSLKLDLKNPKDCLLHLIWLNLIQSNDANLIKDIKFVNFENFMKKIEFLENAFNLEEEQEIINIHSNEWYFSETIFENYLDNVVEGKDLSFKHEVELANIAKWNLDLISKLGWKLALKLLKFGTNLEFIIKGELESTTIVNKKITYNPSTITLGALGTGETNNIKVTTKMSDNHSKIKGSIFIKVNAIEKMAISAIVNNSTRMFEYDLIHLFNELNKNYPEFISNSENVWFYKNDVPYLKMSCEVSINKIKLFTIFENLE